MDLHEAMRTTPATRTFTGDPLPDEVLYEILDDARFAPNGGNRQAWKVVIVRDPAARRRLGELYDLGWREDAAHQRAGLIPFVASEAWWRNPPDGPDKPAVDLKEARRTPTDDLPGAGPQLLADAPVVLLVLLDLSRVMAMDSGLGRLSISAGGSVYPFVQNILLAARARGFGGLPTTVLVRQEAALRTLLDIPEQFALASTIPLGRPARSITRLRRRPVEEFAVLERFDGDAFTV
jgi:nitroreductase